MLASQIPLKQTDTKPWSPSPWGAKAMTKKKEVIPPKACRCAALEYDTTCVRCGWVFKSKESTELSRSGAFTADWYWALEYLDPRNDIAAFSTFALHVKLTQTLMSDVALAEHKLLTFNRRLLYPVVTVTAGNQCLWFNTSNRNLRCGYLSTGGNIWRMCFSDIFTPWEMKGAFCMTHIHVFHLWYF